MSMPRYPEYKDSGIEWLGEVPGHWHTSKIKFNTYVKGRVGWHGLNSDEFEEVGVHLVTGTDFDNGFVAWDRCYRISETRYLEDPYIQLRENDLLITKDGTIGKLARVKDLPEQASLNSGIFLVRSINQAYLEDFLYWILQSSLFNHFMDLHKVGSTIQHLYQEVLNQFAFPIPSQSEQQIICTFLDLETRKIDTLIAEQKRLVGLLTEKRQAVISHAVTKGLNPKAPMKDSGIEWLGEVPGHWEIAPLGYLAILIQTGPFGSQLHSEDYVEGETPVINPSNIQDGNLVPDWSCTVTEEIVARLSQHKLMLGDIVFGRRGEMGRCAMVTTNEVNWLCGTGSLNVRLSSRVIPEFVSIYLRTAYVRELLKLESVGSTMDNLNTQILSCVPVPLPPLTEQQAIATFLDSETSKFDALTAEARRAIALLQEHRNALISAAVTGKIDVRGLGAIKEAA